MYFFLQFFYLSSVQLAVVKTCPRPRAAEDWHWLGGGSLRGCGQEDGQEGGRFSSLMSGRRKGESLESEELGFGKRWLSLWENLKIYYVFIYHPYRTGAVQQCSYAAMLAKSLQDLLEKKRNSWNSLILFREPWASSLWGPRGVDAFLRGLPSLLAFGNSSKCEKPNPKGKAGHSCMLCFILFLDSLKMATTLLSESEVYSYISLEHSTRAITF